MQDQFGNIIPGNVITAEYAGQTIHVTIISICDENSCWGLVNVEDKILPTIECDCPPGEWLTNPDCQATCLEVGSLTSGLIGSPTISDNCINIDAVFGGYDINPGVECGEYIVTQTWTAYLEDEYGNLTHTGLACTNEFYVFAADFGLIDYPDAEVIVECDEDIIDPFDPENSGYPTLGGNKLGVANQGNNFCNLLGYYSDVEIPICNDEDLGAMTCSKLTKVVRTWSVLDWCNGESESFTQVIKLIDTTPPTITGQDIVISVNPWECAADVWIADDYEPAIHDNCSYGLDWYITSTNSGAILTDATGNPNGNPKKHAINVPKGDWIFTLATHDCCGNFAYDEINVSVVDKTPPTPIAHLNLVVGLTTSGQNDGKSKIFSSSVDNGSFDMCGNVRVEIRRDSDNCGINGNRTYSNRLPTSCDSDYRSNDLDNGDFVSFCCEDLGVDGDGDGEDDGMIKVWMRVWDDGNMDGIFGSYEIANGKCEILDNYNETWIYVTVENKVPGLIICPPDITIECDWDYTDLSITGMATASTPCGISEVDYIDRGDTECGEGVITREWFVVGQPESKCNQRISVIQNGNQGLNVQCPFPNEVTVGCADYEIPDPWFGTGACSLAGITSTIDTFYFEQDACYKVIKQWTIIDWCTGEELTCSFNLAMIDSNAPTIMCQDTCVAIDDYWDADNDGNFCELANDIIVTNPGAMDTGDCPSEWFNWIVKIDYWNDGVFDAEMSSFLPHSSGNYIEPTQTGQEVRVRLRKNLASTSGGFHRLEWKAFDGCGNNTQCEQIVEVTDKKAPTPYCLGISTALMDESAGNLVELWAVDFNLGSFDNCTEQENLLYTFEAAAPILSKLNQVHYFDENGERSASAYETGFPVQKWNPATNSSAAKFIGIGWCGNNTVTVSVWDEKFNTDYCLVNLIIEGTACISSICGTCYEDVVNIGVVGHQF